MARSPQDYLMEQSEEDLDILIQLSVDHHELSHSQFLRAYYLYRTQFRRMEHDFYQYRTGTFDEETWSAYVRSFERDTFTTPAARAMNDEDAFVSALCREWTPRASPIRQAGYRGAGPQPHPAEPWTGKTTSRQTH